MKPVVLLDSSVVIASLGSSTGASHGTFSAVKKQQAFGFVSQSILDEIKPRLYKVNRTLDQAMAKIVSSNITVLPTPSDSQLAQHNHIVSDPKDAHLFAIASTLPNCILVSLDKKHILSLKTKVKTPRIMSPAEFLQSLVATDSD